MTRLRSEAGWVVALAMLCGLLFLRGALVPGQTVVPFAPELFGVIGAEAAAAGTAPELADLEGNLGTGDKYHQTLALDRILGDRLAQGEFPRWTRAIGGGIHFTPHLVQSYHPLAWSTALVPAVDLYGWWFLLHQLVLGVTCFGFLRRLGVAPAAASLGVIAACLGFWTQARIQHVMHLTSALPVFWVLSLIWDLFRAPAAPGATLRRSALLALGIGASWLGAFPTHSIHLTWLAGAWACVLAWGAWRGDAPAAPRTAHRPRPWVLLACAAGAVVAGAMLAAPQVLATWQASTISSRTMDGAAALAHRSLEIDHLLHLFWPDLIHWPSDAFLPTADGGIGARPSLAALVALAGINTSGACWTEAAFGIGATGSILALLGLASAPRRWALVFGAVAVFAAGVACAAPPFLAVARALPLFAVSDVKRTVFLLAVALPVLAAWGAHRVARAPVARAWAWGWSGLGVLSLGAGVFVATRSLPEFLYGVAWLYTDGDADAARAVVDQASALWLPGEPEINQYRVAQTLAVSGIVAILGGVLLRWGGPRGGVARTAGLATLLLVELVWIGHGSFTHVARERVVTPPKLLAPILDAARPGAPAPRMITLARPRAADNLEYLPPNLPAFYGVEDCATYNPLPPRRMEAFFLCVEPEAEGRQPAVRIGSGVGFLRVPGSLDHPLLDVFGVRYVLADRRLGRPGLVEVTPPGVGTPYRLFERQQPLPRATWVTDVTRVAAVEDAIEFWQTPGRDARSTVLEALDAPSIPIPSPDAATPTVELAMERAEEVRVRVAADHPGYLRLADPWDPGWTATVDGAPAPLYVADIHLRAVFVPAGEHEVVFRFDGPWIAWPPRLGLLGAALIAAGLVLAHRRRRRAPS